jgi:hypothetical protein
MLALSARPKLPCVSPGFEDVLIVKRNDLRTRLFLLSTGTCRIASSGKDLETFDLNCTRRISLYPVVNRRCTISTSPFDYY